MDIFNNILKKKNSVYKPTGQSVSKMKELVKTFAKFVVETNHQLKDRKTTSNKMNYLPSRDVDLKQKIVEFIKNNFKEKGYKSDAKSFFLAIASEYYRTITNILHTTQLLNSGTIKDEDIISFIKHFYDFEDELYISDNEIIHKVLEDDSEDSYLISLLGSLHFVKICDVQDTILDKEHDISDIGAKTVSIMYIFHKILKYTNEKEKIDENFTHFVNKAINHIIPFFVRLFSELVDDPEMKTVFLLINSDDLVKIFNDLSYIKIIRKSLFDIFIKVNTLTRDGIKIRNFRKYVIDNKCLEGILSSIKKNYFMKNYDDLNEIFKEVINMLIIHISFYENQKDLKNEIFNFLLKIFEDLQNSNQPFEKFIIKSKYYIQEIFYLSYAEKDDMKYKISDKNLHYFESTQQLVSSFNSYRDPDIIEFLINLFDYTYCCYSIEQVKFEKAEYIRKLIFVHLLDSDLNLQKYRFLLNNTNYCSKILENLNRCSEEIISYPFNTILILLSENSPGGNVNINVSFSLSNFMDNTIVYFPEKEIKSIMKNLDQFYDENILNIILKHFRTFLDFSNSFQRLFISCGFITKLLEIFDKTLDYFDFLNNPTPNNYVNELKIFSSSMLISLINLLELLLNNNPENILIVKSYQLLDNYFDKFTCLSDYKIIAYKVWSLSILYEQDTNEINKYTKFLLKRYSLLKETLTKNENFQNFKFILEEILNINEIISIYYFNENPPKIVSLNYHPLIQEIFIDFINIIENLKLKDNMPLNSNPPIQTNLNYNSTELSSIQQNNSEGDDTKIILNNLHNIGEPESENSNLLNDNDVFINIKKYFKFLVDLLIHFNKMNFNIVFKNLKLNLNTNIANYAFTFIKLKDIKKIIFNTITFLSNISIFDNKKYLNDFIKFMIDNALRFKIHENKRLSKSNQVVNNQNPVNLNEINLNNTILLPDRNPILNEIFEENFTQHYKTNFFVDETTLNNSYSISSNYTNFFIQSPFLLEIILSCLIKANDYHTLNEFLEFIEFLCKANENNIKLLLGKKLVKKIFKIENNSKIYDILEIVAKFLKKSDLEIIFSFILININNPDLQNNLLRLTNILYKGMILSRKVRKNVILSSVITRQPNIYNMLYTGNINFNSQQNNFKEPNNINSKSKVNFISIFLSIKFHKICENLSPLTLFKFERETKEKDLSALEVNIESNILIIRENEKEVYRCEELTKHIRLEKTQDFLFFINKDCNLMEIYVNDKLLSAFGTEFKFLDLNYTYTLSTGYSGASTKELYQETFQNFPHVSISYFMIYLDKINNENMMHLKLSQISNSKNGSARSGSVKMKYLNSKTYKMFAPNYLSNKETLKNIKIYLDSSKIIYELVMDKFDILSNNKLQKLKNDSNLCNNFIYKIQRKYHIDLNEKDMIVYIRNSNLTNTFLDPNSNNKCAYNYNNIFDHTILLSKTNLSDTIYFNSIYDSKSIKKIIKNEILFNPILECEIQSFPFINYLLGILNEIEISVNIRDSNENFNIKQSFSHFSSNLNNSSNVCIDKIIFSIFKMMSAYLLSNMHEMADFYQTDHFKTVVILLNKLSKYIKEDLIDLIFNWSFGLEEIKGINFFNPLFPQFITEILLDIHLFKIISSHLKYYLISKIRSFLCQKEYVFIMTEANYELKVNMIYKLYKILMLVDSDNFETENEMIMLINLLLEQTLKFKKGDVEPSEDQLIRIINYTQEFILVSGYFNELATSHLKIKDLDAEQLNTTSYLIKKIFNKLFIGKEGANENLKISREKIVYFFTKIWEDLTTNNNQGNINRRGSNFNLNLKVGNLLDPSFFLKLYSKEISSNRNPMKNTFDREDVRFSVGPKMTENKNLKINHAEKNNLPIYTKTIENFPNKLVMTPDTQRRTIDKTGEILFNFENNKDWTLVNSTSNKSLARNTEPFYNNAGIKTQKSVNNLKNRESNVSMRNPKANNNEEYFDEENNFRLSSVNFDTDLECTGSNCNICKFFKDVLKNYFNFVTNYNSYKKYIKNFYYHFYVLGDIKIADQFLNQNQNRNSNKKNKRINFSWHIMNQEGPARIKNKFKSKIDLIYNEELSKKYYEDLEKVKNEKNHKKSPLAKIFDFINIKEMLTDIFYLDQIFNLNFVKNMVDSDDKFIAAFNCLLISKCYHLDSVLILGINKFYLLQNVHVDKEGNLLFNRFRFQKSFWVVNDYKEEWEASCPYLNDFLHFENNDNTIDFSLKIQNSNSKRINDEIKMYKFFRSRRSFKMTSFDYKDINELHKRRFLLKHNSIEFFMKNGKSFLLAFNIDKRDTIFNSIVRGISSTSIKSSINSNHTSNASSVNPKFTISNSLLQSGSCIYLNNTKLVVKKYKGKRIIKNEKGLVEVKQILDEMTEYWGKGIVSNFNYLMIINTLAGRSYNDLSQYFVLPWIIKDYVSEGLNLNTPEIYRDLNRPIHAIDENTYKNLMQKYSEAEDNDKFHSGSHYSSPGFVCYFMTRMKPYAYVAAEIQGGYFDMADRLFFNIKGLWDVNDKYQELIPEMFYMPEAFVNFNEFNFGYNQSGWDVNDVLLPLWAKNDPRLFVKMNKKALESSKISERINDWIDLIFGYKQQGKDAVKALNIFRFLCYEGKLDYNKLDPKEIEDKMVEVHDFGQVPQQIFPKAHIKKECHEKLVAFFAKPFYLINFLPREKGYTIQLTSKPCEMKGYFETELYLSHGEGGLSSFKIYSADYNQEKDNLKYLDASNTFFITGKNKCLLGPRYTHVIDWSVEKYSLLIVNPIAKVCYEFSTLMEQPISCVKATSNGRIIIVGFNDGSIAFYKLKKEKDKIFHPDEKKKEKGIFKLFSKKETERNILSRSTQAGIGNIPGINYSNTIVENTHTLPSNFNTSEIITSLNTNTLYQYPKIRFFQEEWRDFYVHHTQTGLNFNKNSPKGISYYTLKLIDSKNYINNPIKLIEICETYSLLIVVCSMNNVYLFEMNEYELIRKICFKDIIKSNEDINEIKICHLNGDFVLIADYNVVLFSVNGVPLGNLNMKEHLSILNKNGKITCAEVKSLKNTESELHLFTGHENGDLFMWRLMTRTEENLLDSNRLAYNRFYYKKIIVKNLEFKLKFDEPFEFHTKKNLPLRLIKLTEDSSMLITIHDDLNLNCWSYAEFFVKKQKSKNAKNCPQCNSQLGSSKNHCSICKKKICAQCKIVEIVPEISLKSSNPVCNDCLSMTCSTNKMLYDF